MNKLTTAVLSGVLCVGLAGSAFAASPDYAAQCKELLVSQISDTGVQLSNGANLYYFNGMFSYQPPQQEAVGFGDIRVAATTERVCMFDAGPQNGEEGVAVILYPLSKKGEVYYRAAGQNTVGPYSFNW
jgi:hypothetical protein